LAALVVAAAVIFGLGYTYATMRVPPPEPPVIQRAEETKRVELQVHVAGEVSAPGVYQVALGSRVKDAVELARPLASADLHALNLAAPLQDGQRVLVPKVRLPHPEAGNSGDGAFAPADTFASADPRININTAGRSELEKLPGIGPAMAERIIKHREQHGSFMSVDDLVNVSGIGEKRLEGMRDMVTVY
jgi:competence protein ComEA